MDSMLAQHSDDGIVARLNANEISEDDFIDGVRQKYFGKLLAFVEKLDGERWTWADDVVEEVLVKLFLHVRDPIKGKPRWESGAHLQRWLYKVARRTFIDALRYAWAHDWRRVFVKANAEEGGPDLLEQVQDSNELSPEEALLKKESSRSLRLEIDALPHDFREPLILRLLLGGPKEVARSLGRSPGWVSVQITRAKAMLFHALSAGGHVALADCLREHPIDAWAVLLEDDEE